MRCARLGLSPHIVVERWDAERDVHVGPAGQLAQDVDVTDDHRTARDHGRGVREVLQRLQALARQAVATFGGLIRIRGGAYDDGLFAPGALGKLASQDRRDVRLDAHGPSVSII